MAAAKYPTKRNVKMTARTVQTRVLQIALQILPQTAQALQRVTAVMNLEVTRKAPAGLNPAVIVKYIRKSFECREANSRKRLCLLIYGNVDLIVS